MVTGLKWIRIGIEIINFLNNKFNINKNNSILNKLYHLSAKILL
jgi:hypothetical protein